MAYVLAAITPLLVGLGAIVGAGVGWLFVTMIRESSAPHTQREREIELARRSARKAVDETIQRLFPE